MSENYPRDLIGYGASPPAADWPDKARIAVQFVLNYEEGGENAILHGDPASESFLSEMVGTPALQGVRHMSMESLYEYGSRVGVWRLLELFRRFDLPLTVFGVAMAMERNPAAVDAFMKAGHEIASHGWRSSFHTVVISATAAELANHIIEQAPTEQVGITGITAAALFAQVTSLQSDLLVKTTALSDCVTDKTGLQGDLLIKTTELSDCETDKAAALALGALRARGDLDDSGAVGQQDLQRILQHWGANAAADNSARLKDIHKSIRASLKEIRRMRR